MKAKEGGGRNEEGWSIPLLFHKALSIPFGFVLVKSYYQLVLLALHLKSLLVSANTPIYLGADREKQW